MCRSIKYIVFSLLFFCGTSLYSQERMQELFLSIERSSKAWMLYEKERIAAELEYKTDNFLPNPRMEVEMLNRIDQTDFLEFSVVQDFDFPSVYFHKKTIVNNNIELLELQRNIDLQNLFLEAKLLYIERVFLNKRKNVLVQRYRDAKQLYKMLSKSYEIGAIGVLKYNKASLNKLSVQSERASLHRLEHDNRVAITKLNGGVEFVVNDSFYDSTDSLPSLNTLLSEIEQYDAKLLLLKYNEQFSHISVDLAKAQSLPSFYGGYVSQTDVAGSFKGLKFGFTIPLFESKNKVKLAEATSVVSRFERAVYSQDLFVEAEALYHDLKALESLIETYREIEEDYDVEHLLSQSYDLGEISLVDYLNQLAAHYVFIDEKLALEYEYYKSLAVLLKYKL